MVWVCLIRQWKYPIHGPFKTKAAAERWAEGYRYAATVEVVEVTPASPQDGKERA